MNFVINIDEDYRALLESTAVRILPAELVKALGELSGRKRADETMTNLCQAAWEHYTVPVFLKQEPITDLERRGTEYVQKLFEARVAYSKERRKLEGQVLELLGKHNLGR